MLCGLCVRFYFFLCFGIDPRLSTITNADMIVVMQKGEIVERGTHSDLMAKGELGVYYQLRKHQHVHESEGGANDKDQASSEDKESEEVSQVVGEGYYDFTKGGSGDCIP